MITRCELDNGEPTVTCVTGANLLTTTHTIPIALQAGCRPPEIVVKRHRVTASVRWEIRSLDCGSELPHVFARRCERMGLPAALEAWWERHEGGFCRRALMAYGSGYGMACFVVPAAADELARIIAHVWSRAVVDLPPSWPIRHTEGLTS